MSARRTAPPVPSEQAVDRRDAEELAEALEALLDSILEERRQLGISAALGMDRSHGLAALSRFRSKYPKEDQ